MKPDRWKRLGDSLIEDIKFAMALAPFIEDQSTRSDGARLPVSGTGSGGGSQLDYSDPTQAQAVQLVDGNSQRRGGPYEEQHDRLTLRDLRRYMQHLSGFINSQLASRASAAATAVREGRPPTSGKDQAEVLAEKQHRRATYQKDECLVCGEIADTKLGLCTTRHYFAWYRSADRAQGADKGAWVARMRHAFLVDELVGRGIYGGDLVALSNRELEEIVAGKRRPPRPGRGDWDTSVHSSIGPADGKDRRK